MNRSGGGGHKRRVGLPPMVGNAPRVLVLGTIPSVLSSQRMQYYGNPRNHFWRLMSVVLGAEMPAGYSERCAVLTSNGIALWDVLAECEVRGSGDRTIINPVPNDIRGFLKEHESIHHVFVNGSTAFRLYLKFHAEAFKGDAIALPSSSPANAVRWPERCVKWMAIREAL